MIEGVVEGPGPSVRTEPLTLREKRVLFVRLLARFIRWAEKQGLELALGEGMIDTPRRVHTDQGYAIYADAQFLPRSYHYLGLAQDLYLSRGGEPITDPTHPCWELIAEHWESMHLLCTSGVRQISTRAQPVPDADRLCRAGVRHVSLGEGTKVYPLPWKR